MLDLSPLNERVYQLLLRRILSGEAAPGGRLDAEELSQTLGVSRTPVKDALTRLCAEGLVEITPRRGTRVTALTRRDIQELHDVRRMIELYAAHSAIKAASPQHQLRLREILHELEGIVRVQDVVE